MRTNCGRREIGMKKKNKQIKSKRKEKISGPIRSFI
jgi:hypothetical protein